MDSIYTDFSIQTIQTDKGFRGALKRPSGVGQRMIILNIINEDGFLNECLKCIIGKKGPADCHDEMNNQLREKWLKFVLAVIPDKSVIGLD